MKKKGGWVPAVVFGLLLMGGTSGAAHAAPGSHGFPRIPENVESRLRYRELIFAAADDARSAVQTTLEQPVSGLRVRFRVMEQDGYFYHAFINENDGEFMLNSAGTYIIKRSVDSGEFVQIKVFLQTRDDSFVRMYPDGSRTRMEVHLLGTEIYRNVAVALPFERVILEPFAVVMAMTEHRVDWRLFGVPSGRAEDDLMRRTVESVRALLPSLRDSDDGALDSDGIFRFIEDLSINPAGGLNCSGFAKWIVDGLYYPEAGSFLDIVQLKAKHTGLRGNPWSERYEDERDPYFGLDWTRNLAVAMRSLYSQRPIEVESADVRRVPFFEYVENVGYPVSQIQLIGYLLALTDPGHIYLGSINKAYGSRPVLRQHTHVVVLMPYFDRNGHFRGVVAERNVETSAASLVRRYEHDFVHLVRVPLTGGFLPPGAGPISAEKEVTFD